MNTSLPTSGLDFSKITLRDALDLALLVEEEARDRYEEFAEQLSVHHTPEAAAFFAKMARVEEKHRLVLQARRVAEFGSEPSTVRRAMIFDIEAPEYDEARVHMTVRQALEVALRSEEKAQDFFAAALHFVRDPSIQALFEELRDEEIEHQGLVRAEMARVPPDLPGRTADYEDEPAPH